MHSAMVRQSAEYHKTLYTMAWRIFYVGAYIALSIDRRASRVEIFHYVYTPESQLVLFNRLSPTPVQYVMTQDLGHE